MVELTTSVSPGRVHCWQSLRGSRAGPKKFKVVITMAVRLGQSKAEQRNLTIAWMPGRGIPDWVISAAVGRRAQVPREGEVL